MYEPLAYLVAGLCLAVAGAFIAARLMKLDRLWAQRDDASLDLLADQLAAAATIASQDDPSHLRGLADRAGHVLLSAGLYRVASGVGLTELKQALLDQSRDLARRDERWRFAGRLLSYAAPVAGLGCMVGALIVGLRSLQDATSMSAGGAVGIVVLLVAAPLMNAVARRLPKADSTSIARGELLAIAITEAVLLVRQGASAADVRGKFDAILGRTPAPVAFSRAA